MRVTRTIKCRGAILLLLATLLGCGGGGDSTGGTGEGPTASGKTAYSVEVRIVDTSGQPIPAVAVSLNGSFDGMSSETDAAGVARFTFSSYSPGEGVIDTWDANHYVASRRFPLAEEDQPCRSAVTVANR